MPLAPGTQFGPYEILDPLGAGAMGEVYRARDTRLDRTVAVKVLPKEMSADPVRKQRFKREAKAISSLNHPHICVLHDVGQQNGMDYLVMECLEGETLAIRLEKGPLPLEQVLKYGAQIAHALDRAHRAGIVHRDLKPGNIMLTETGAKLLDFGLAKPNPRLVSAMAETVTSHDTPVTEQGTISGTFQYMSPEQVEGKDVDGRSDIFSLGAVLYEMVTGKRAFEGKSQLSVASAVLEKEPPPIGTLKPMTPPALNRALKKCLTKSPEERWQSARDLASELEWIAEDSSQCSGTAALAVQGRNNLRILTPLALASLTAAILFGVSYWNRGPADVHAIRAYIKPAEGSNFILTKPSGGFAISPDGLTLAYIASTPSGSTFLWVQPIDSLQGKALAGTEGAGLPFWSPDSRFIGFFAEEKLKKIDATGGPPFALCEVPFPRGGSWNRDGVILFSSSPSAPLYRISAAGGTATPVTELDTSKGEMSHRWPYFLPDGDHFLYLAGPSYSTKENSTAAIRLGSLDSKASKLLVYAHGSAIYASGHILFLRQNTLMAQPFDTKRLELTGEAIPVDDPVLDDTSIFKGVFSASDSGRLTYVRSSAADTWKLNWVDRTGRRVGQVPGAGEYSGPYISPDGKTVAYTLLSTGYDIWSYDVSRQVETRLTFRAASTSASSGAVWSPDGRWIAYLSVHNGRYAICRKLSDGSGTEEVLLEGSEQQRWPTDWSPDGKLILYNEARQGVTTLYLLPLNEEHNPRPFRQSNFNEGYARFSPNGKWVAYCSDESGENRVYVVPFQGPGGKVQMSSGGGCRPRWRRDGKELFYLSSDNKVMAVKVETTGSSFQAGAVQVLFEARSSDNFESYDVTADGQRFIVAQDKVEPNPANTAITLFANWDAALKRK